MSRYQYPFEWFRKNKILICGFILFVVDFQTSCFSPFFVRRRYFRYLCSQDILEKYCCRLVLYWRGRMDWLCYIRKLHESRPNPSQAGVTVVTLTLNRGSQPQRHWHLEQGLACACGELISMCGLRSADGRRVSPIVTTKTYTASVPRKRGEWRGQIFPGWKPTLSQRVFGFLGGKWPSLISLTHLMNILLERDQEMWCNYVGRFM